MVYLQKEKSISTENNICVGYKAFTRKTKKYTYQIQLENSQDDKNLYPEHFKLITATLSKMKS